MLNSVEAKELREAIEAGNEYVAELEAIGVQSHYIKPLVDRVLKVFRKHVTAGNVKEVDEACRKIHMRLAVYFGSKIGSIKNVSAEEHIKGRLMAIRDFEALIAEQSNRFASVLASRSSLDKKE